MNPRLRRSVQRTLPVALLLFGASCASVSFQRDTQTSGTFQSSGWALTIVSIDIPKPAMLIARENASDANLANMRIDEVKVIPYLGGLDWLLDILGLRYVRIRGRWGFTGDDAEAGAPASS